MALFHGNDVNLSHFSKQTMNTKDFSIRHIGIDTEAQTKMLQSLGLNSLDTLIEETLPKDIRLEQDLAIPKALSEYEMLHHSHRMASQNLPHQCYIGMGYHGTVVPSVIQRNILENPGWYTAYTPYQAEISQGRLEALLNFQTMVSDLTGLPIANASLLDEATAAAEAMHLLYASRSREQKKENALSFFISNKVLPQTISVLKTKAKYLEIDLVVGDYNEVQLDQKFFGALLQYPSWEGSILDYRKFISEQNNKGIKIILACDILALTLLESPAELGADIAIGTTQRLGIPLGYGGPHAAFFACKEEYLRQLPGRIIGMSEDRQAKPALRMALQTREQHIKREKATSNICTAQVLLAVMAGMYAVYHGKEGLLNIAHKIHNKASILFQHLEKLGYIMHHQHFFDTVTFSCDEIERMKIFMEERDIILNYFIEGKVSISLHEACTQKDFRKLLQAFYEFKSKDFNPIFEGKNHIPNPLQRTSDFLTHEVFHKFHTETELMRYIKRLENKDLSLTHSMISLGSCTMKLNAATELLPISWSQWADVHPFVPKKYAKGYMKMTEKLECYLSEITGFYATSLQPNSGAQGEYAGLVVIREYQQSIGQGHRNVVLIPQSAHGTNPASGVLAGMQVVVVKNLENGEFDLEDLKEKLEKHKDQISALMITYPSTYGFFDDDVKAVTDMVHQYGGQVYMDGANMNAQMGLTSPGAIGADVCHLNLHKTFAIPHGGGGPGVGPICAAQHLAPFLPRRRFSEEGIRISSAGYGSALILNISYAYIRMLGAKGLRKCAETAILSANYVKKQLEAHFPVLYTNDKDRVAHELIVDFRPFKELGIEVVDIAKRLMDYGFHAPTVSFPVAGTLMIEPTESESLEELDRFIEALITIKSEIEEIAMGTSDKDSNVLKNAPHTLEVMTSENWDYDYSREKACYPLDWVRERKFFASVSRIKEAQGDRNLICTCNPIEDYI